MLPFVLEVATLSLLFCMAIHYLKKRAVRSQLPPGKGPWSFPLGFGHLPMMGLNPLSKLLEWKKRYGPIILVEFGVFPHVVISDGILIREAFSRPEFSDRPSTSRSIQASQRRGIGFSNGVHNLEQRQITRKVLNAGHSTIVSNMEEEISMFLSEMTSKEGQPTVVQNLFSLRVVNPLWETLMGQQLDKNDTELASVMQSIHRNIVNVPGLLSEWGRFIPWLDYLVQIFQSNPTTATWTQLYAYIFKQVECVKQNWIPGQPQLLAHVYMDKVESTTDPSSSFHKQRKFLPYWVADLFTAGLETDSFTLEWLMHYMATNPDIQSEFHKEIDRVIGQHRSPSLDDRPLMPYAEALAMEILRISSVAPLGISHCTTEKVSLGPYTLPKGTIVISNIHATHMCPQTWGDPDNFRPERFLQLDEDGNFKLNLKPALLEQFIPFGQGRRMCLGEKKARAELFLFSTSLFQRYSVRPVYGDPPVRPVFGPIVHPTEFRVIFMGRSLNK